ncbi:hypothetical protein [Flavobacterium sp. JP2137]|uniref:hypothetical protein n=1 Tax=Flavobacterium sp. JP2137 TaxID=3414510 RepID=UPI003D2FABD2
MKNLVLLSMFFFISCGSKTGEEFFFKVDSLPLKNDYSELLYVQDVTMFYLNKNRKDKNSICFTVKIDQSSIKNQFENIRFRLFHGKNSYEYVSMFPPTVSEEDTVFICFSQDEMEGTKLDSIINSMEEVYTNEKIRITKYIIKDVKLYLYFENKDSTAVPLSKKTLFSFYLRDKSMLDVY